MSTDKPVVVFEEWQTYSGFKIGHATLAKPAALNALDLQMIKLLTPQLKKWQADPKIAMVLLDSEGDKAFCAGGDIVTMYHSMQDAQKSPAKAGEPMALEEFFSKEYELDYLIHTFEKPFMVWGNGIVMGGGLGLMSGASHRIVTQSSRLAMPEISIGLYPDVGGSYFLNKMPAGCGMFLGLTGASINATDALYVKLADYFVPQEQKSSLIEQLQKADWQAKNFAQTLTQICQNLDAEHASELPPGNMQAKQPWFNELAQKQQLEDAIEFVLAADSEQDKWLAKAQKSLKAGSPLSANLLFEQLKRGKNLSLAECFRMELGMSCQCGEFGEFQEGVRALLIDKDYQPNWRFKTVQEVSKDALDSFFATLWPADAHPLAHLGKSQ
ncbi:enoyl-CoA hydratase/isomerase family protein [Paraglaciecola aestuariivivens]